MDREVSLQRPVLVGQIIRNNELGFVDPEAIEEHRANTAFAQWVEAMTRTETDEERTARFETEMERIKRIRPNFDKPVPFGLCGLDRLSREYWGQELLSLSLLFVANNTRWEKVIPEEFEIEPLMMKRTSLSMEFSLYVLMVSSLYWALEENDLEFDEARTKVQQITWIFGLGPKRIKDFESQEEYFKKALDEYHGIYSHYEPRNFDGTETTKYVRNVLDGKKVEVPKKLEGWIARPLMLLADFGVDSRLKYFVDYKGENIEDHVYLIDR